MDLPRAGREYYTLELDATDVTGATLDPQPTGYDATFDSGLTWVAGVALEGQPTWWQWLLSGPDFVPDGGDDTPSTTLTRGVLPQVRLKDSPEVIVKIDPPRVTLI